MSPLRRFLTAFIFWPLFILWFIPKEAYRAYRKANRMQVALSHKERLDQAKLFFKQEIKVALASRTRKPIDYSYLDQELQEVKKIASRAEKKVIETELGVVTDGQTQGRPRE